MGTELAENGVNCEVEEDDCDLWEFVSIDGQQLIGWKGEVMIAQLSYYYALIG